MNEAIKTGLNEELESELGVFKVFLERAKHFAKETVVKDKIPEAVVTDAKDVRSRLEQFDEDQSMRISGVIEQHQYTVDASKAHLYPHVLRIALESIGVTGERNKQLVEKSALHEFTHLASSYDITTLEERMLGVGYYTSTIDGEKRYVLEAFVTFKGSATKREILKVIGATVDEGDGSTSDKIMVGDIV